MELSASILKEEKNIEFKLKVGPFDQWLKDQKVNTPSDLQAGQAKVEDAQGEDSSNQEIQPSFSINQENAFPIQVELRMDQIALGELTPYLPPDLPVDLKKLTLDSTLKIEIVPESHVKSSGHFQALNFRLTLPKQPSTPQLKFELQPSVNIDLQKETLKLKQFKILLNQMGIVANGNLSHLKSQFPRFNNLKIQSQNLDLDRLFKLLPMAKSALPPKSTLKGPFSFTTIANGNAQAQKIKFEVDLDPLTIFIPQTFRKTAKTPLSFKTNMDISPKKINIKELTF